WRSKPAGSSWARRPVSNWPSKPSRPARPRWPDRAPGQSSLPIPARHRQRVDPAGSLMDKEVRMTSTPSKLGVGIIGVSPTRGWAAAAHIPALRALPNYEIRALSAASAESARAAGEVFGVSVVFSDHEQLVIQPDIDLVAVTVKVPHHRELASAALAAGKAVYCEWPLGRDLDDARAMATLAAERGVRTVVGLQARQAPAIEFVQE